MLVLTHTIYRWIRNNGDSICSNIYAIEYKDDYDEVILDFEEEKILKNGYLISNSLGSDIFSDFDSIKEEIEQLIKVLSGELPIFESGGNLNLISSDKHKTVVEDIFADEGEDSICTIETVEYTKIILIWAKENIKYKNKRGILTTEEADERIEWIEEKFSELDFIKWGKNIGFIRFITKRIWRWWKCGLQIRAYRKSYVQNEIK